MGREPPEALFPGGQVGAVAAALSRSAAVIDHRVGQEGVVADELVDPDVGLGDSRGVVGQDGVDLAPAAGFEVDELYSLKSPVFIVNLYPEGAAAVIDLTGIDQGQVGSVLPVVLESVDPGVCR